MGRGGGRGNCDHDILCEKRIYLQYEQGSQTSSKMLCNQGVEKGKGESEVAKASTSRKISVKPEITEAGMCLKAEEQVACPDQLGVAVCDRLTGIRQV